MNNLEPLFPSTARAQKVAEKWRTLPGDHFYNDVLYFKLTKMKPTVTLHVSNSIHKKK
jgi:hypothetical protein